ncbi:hypothetical protein WT97_30800 [Burkholderia sp. MSMB1459WGS]|uniref:hypothetical protein n=1 Tax=Burkholderia sp. MSMB1459WGS TaxID=1637970 RepID=UPI00075FE2AF|nr:hypothetical protein [Burkholderia sp. MSMB1459WGS]KWO35541.1 hypothetical protein WT97_30800 [Burkholderia sp. MSMB1459WGS]
MTQTDLLSYLVTSQLAARMRSGAWLTTGQLVGALRAWLACRHAECDWLDRIRIAHASATIAQEIYEIALAHGDPHSGERVRIDADSPELQALRARCDALLQWLDGDRDVGAR